MVRRHLGVQPLRCGMPVEVDEGRVETAAVRLRRRAVAGQVVGDVREDLGRLQGLPDRVARPAVPRAAAVAHQPDLARSQLQETRHLFLLRRAAPYAGLDLGELVKRPELPTCPGVGAQAGERLVDQRVPPLREPREDPAAGGIGRRCRDPAALGGEGEVADGQIARHPARTLPERLPEQRRVDVLQQARLEVAADGRSDADDHTRQQSADLLRHRPAQLVRQRSHSSSSSSRGRGRPRIQWSVVRAPSSALVDAPVARASPSGSGRDARRSRRSAPHWRRAVSRRSAGRVSTLRASSAS